MKPIRVVSACALFLGFTTSTHAGTLITYNFTGHVTEVTDNTSFALNRSIPIGTSVTGSFTYDSSIAGSPAGPNLTFYDGAALNTAFATFLSKRLCRLTSRAWASSGLVGTSIRTGLALRCRCILSRAMASPLKTPILLAGTQPIRAYSRPSSARRSRLQQKASHLRISSR
jgi:hypothetical protein